VRTEATATTAYEAVAPENQEKARQLREKLRKKRANFAGNARKLRKKRAKLRKKRATKLEGRALSSPFVFARRKRTTA
jgi:hypothetical protein